MSAQRRDVSDYTLPEISIGVYNYLFLDGRCGTGRLVLGERALFPCVVDGIFTIQDNLGDGQKGVAIFQQGFDDTGQGLGGVLGGVVEQYDGAGTFYGQVYIY